MQLHSAQLINGKIGCSLEQEGSGIGQFLRMLELVDVEKRFLGKIMGIIFVFQFASQKTDQWVYSVRPPEIVGMSVLYPLFSSACWLIQITLDRVQTTEAESDRVSVLPVFDNYTSVCQGKERGNGCVKTAQKG